MADHAIGASTREVNWFLLIIGFVAAGGFWFFLRTRSGWLIRAAHPRPVSPPRMLVVVAWQLLAAPALAMILAGFLLPAPGDEAATLKELTIQTLLVQSVMLPLVFLWFGLGRAESERAWVVHARARIGVRRAPAAPASPLGAIGAGVVGLLIAWPIVMGTGELTGLAFEYLTGEAPPMIAHKTLETLASADLGDPWLIMMTAAVVLLAPLLEEVVYRGAVHGCLRGLMVSPWPAIVLSAMLFASMHFGTAANVAIPGLLVLGIGLSIVYERTGTLLAPIVMHALFNLGNIGLLLLIKPAIS